MKYFYLFTRIAVGVLFIISGLAKLFPIEPFENTFIELGVSNWLIVPFLARFVIVIELFIGFTIVFNLWLKNKIYYLAQVSLLLFTIYLIYLFIAKGNNVDCGCFGELIKLSPIESIAKNIVLMIALFFIPKPYYRYGVGMGVTFLLAISIALPIVLNPIGIHNIQGIELNEKIDFSGLPAVYKSNRLVDFSKDKKIVGFLTYKCSHCINAANKLVLLDKKQKINNLYLVVGSKKEKGLIQFLEKTKPRFPILWMNDDSFYKYSGARFPAIVYIENGIIKRKWIGDRFDVDDISKYFNY
jgi:uncharacterized membrane protein YphA (DoxX/SURF4 family)